MHLYEVKYEGPLISKKKFFKIQNYIFLLSNTHLNEEKIAPDGSLCDIFRNFQKVLKILILYSPQQIYFSTRHRTELLKKLRHKFRQQLGTFYRTKCGLGILLKGLPSPFLFLFRSAKIIQLSYVLVYWFNQAAFLTSLNLNPPKLDGNR